jgi:hypothetical protein
VLGTRLLHGAGADRALQLIQPELFAHVELNQHQN